MTEMADPRAAEQLLQMIRGSWISQIVGTLAQLEIADHLARSPQQSGTLADGIGCDPDATFRLLRAGVNVGLVSMLPDGRFGLTPMGELLRSNVPGSLRDSAIAWTAPGHWLPWGRLAEVVRRGERQTVAALGHELFDYYAVNPGEGGAFTGAMANVSNAVANELAQVFDTSGVNHVLDIGGASGTIVAALLEANPALRGTIFERADVVPRAEAALAERGLSPRCRAVAGDFFESVPEADLYILKSVVHDWDDSQSVKILRNCAAHSSRMAVSFSSKGSFPSTETQARQRSSISICLCCCRDANVTRANLQSCFAHPDCGSIGYPSSPPLWR